MGNETGVKILEARDICRILGIALSNVYKLFRQPDFPAIRVSARRFIVPEDAFVRWLSDQAAAKKAGNGVDREWAP